jgi:hypothetical protein
MSRAADAARSSTPGTRIGALKPNDAASSSITLYVTAERTVFSQAETCAELPTSRLLYAAC